MHDGDAHPRYRRRSVWVVFSTCMKRFSLYALLAIIISLTIAVPLAAEGQSERRSDIDNGVPEERTLLELYPAVDSGRLENGMEYYTLEHPFPEDTVVLRLVVDAGSVLETESQRGLAHFVEHMAFNGTEAFGETELVAYLERLGMQFGPDVNAYTSFDETVYKLEIPLGSGDALETGFNVMAQWAHALTLDPEAIDRERGVIVEEWRRGRSASQRILREHVPVLFAGSRYAERLPIGEMDVVRNAPPAEFEAFYRRWYRPDNMAFIAVGDLPTEELRRLTEKYLAPITRPDGPLDRPYPFVPDQPGTRVSIAGDPEAQRSTVSLYTLAPPSPLETRGDYRALLVRSLFASIVNERLQDIARDPDAPITAGGLGWNRFLRGTEIAAATGVVRNDRVLDAFEVITREIERAHRHGVTTAELDRARERFFQSIDAARVNFDTRPSASLADELVRYWLEGEAMPGIEAEYRLYQEFLPSITVSEVSAVAEEFIASDNRVILASLRTQDDAVLPNGSPVPEAADFENVLRRVADQQIAPPEEASIPDTLIDAEAITPGRVVAERDHPSVETTELHLSNGMRLFLKPTELTEDEILFSAYSPGGLALVPDELVAAAELAPQVAGASGIGDVDRSTLEKILSGRSVDLAAQIGRVSETMSGQTRSTDLELLFQLIHLSFVDPRFDATQLRNVKQQTIQSIEGALASPDGRFSRRFSQLFAAGDPRLRSLEIDEVEGVTLDQIETVYRDRFSDPSDFALVFVGSFQVDRIRSLAERYLAGIGTAAELGASDSDGEFVETIPSERYPRPEGVVQETVRAGTEPVGRYAAVIHGPYEWSRRMNHRFNSLADLLDIRLRERIREEAGGSYSIGAGGWRWRYPEPWAYMQIVFGMDPERRGELTEIVYDVVEELRTTVPTNEYLERVKAQQRERYRQSIQRNGYWLSTIQFYVQHGRDLAEITTFPELIESLTAEEIQAAAERYLDPARRIEIVLLPESSGDTDR